MDNSTTPTPPVSAPQDDQSQNVPPTPAPGVDVGTAPADDALQSTPPPPLPPSSDENVVPSVPPVSDDTNIETPTTDVGATVGGSAEPVGPESVEEMPDANSTPGVTPAAPISPSQNEPVEDATEKTPPVPPVPPTGNQQM